MAGYNRKKITNMVKKIVNSENNSAKNTNSKDNDSNSNKK